MARRFGRRVVATTVCLSGVVCWSGFSAPGFAFASGKVARAPGLIGARTSPGVTLGISTLYTASLSPGTWVPVTLSVSNPEAADFSGEIVVSSVPAQTNAGGETAGGCYSNGPTTFTCLSEGSFSSGLAFGPRTAPSDSSSVTVHDGRAEAGEDQAPAAVKYDLPVTLAPGTAKQLVVDVLAGPTGGEVSAEVRARRTGSWPGRPVIWPWPPARRKRQCWW